MPKQRHLRPDDRLDDDDTIVIRGGDLNQETLRADAERYHSIYGEYAISVFATRDATVDELAQQAPLVRFEDARRDLFERLLADLAPNDRRLVVNEVTRLAAAAHALG